MKFFNHVKFGGKYNLFTSQITLICTPSGLKILDFSQIWEVQGMCSNDTHSEINKV